MVLISMAIGFVATRFFGKDRDDADQDVQGDLPFVRAAFAAMNEGEFDALRELIDDGCRVYANGHRLQRGSFDLGPEVIVGTIQAFRDELPDLRWELYDELAGKDDGVAKVAFRFVSSATVDGKVHQVEVAMFIILEDGKAIEWREVLDMTLANERRTAAGLPVIE